eukprot:g4542.t1
MPTVTDTPLCWGGDLLVQTFNIKVNSYDGTSGTVDMEMRGPTSGQCTETPFENNNNEISLGEQHECGLGDSEYTVKYCPDQDQFVIDIVKPWTIEVTLKSQEHSPLLGRRPFGSDFQHQGQQLRWHQWNRRHGDAWPNKRPMH